MKNDVILALNRLRQESESFFAADANERPKTVSFLLEDEPWIISDSKYDIKQKKRFQEHLQTLESLKDEEIVLVEIPDQSKPFDIKKLLSKTGYCSGGPTMTRYIGNINVSSKIKKQKGGKFMIIPNHKDGFDDEVLMYVFGMNIRDLHRVFYLQYALTISEISEELKTRNIISVGHASGLRLQYLVGSIKWFNDEHGQDWSLCLSKTQGKNITQFLMIPI